MGPTNYTTTKCELLIKLKTCVLMTKIIQHFAGLSQTFEVHVHVGDIIATTTR